MQYDYLLCSVFIAIFFQSISTMEQEQPIKYQRTSNGSVEIQKQKKQDLKRKQTIIPPLHVLSLSEITNPEKQIELQQWTGQVQALHTQIKNQSLPFDNIENELKKQNTSPYQMLQKINAAWLPIFSPFVQYPDEITLYKQYLIAQYGLYHAINEEIDKRKFQRLASSMDIDITQKDAAIQTEM